jgi:hypothetical protein
MAIMKTTLDLVDVVYGVLKVSSLKGSISGKVYEYQRPVNSNVEDVVINSLPITNQQLQQAIVNVNVFVPNLAVEETGDISRQVPDVTRLKTLAGLAVQELTDGISGDYTWDVQQQTLIQEEESGQHFINIRIQFFVSNI